MYKLLETLEDLEEAFKGIPEHQRDAWAISFWNVFSQGLKLYVR